MSPNDKPVYNFVFLRHGESIGNAESRWQGQSDYALTEKGRLQAQALARRWKSEGVKFDLIIASPLVRARETAQIIASAVDARLELDTILMERHIGSVERNLQADPRAQNHAGGEMKLAGEYKPCYRLVA